MPRQRLGDRHPTTVRPPKDQHAVYKSRADQLGLDLGNYTVLVMACVHDQPVPGYIVDQLASGPGQAYINRADELRMQLRDYFLAVVSFLHDKPIPEHILEQLPNRNPADLLPTQRVAEKVA